MASSPQHPSTTDSVLGRTDSVLWRPRVSVVLPVRNEAEFLGPCLERLVAQDYPTALMEILVADGRSTDQTRQVAADFQRGHPDVALRVIDNPEGTVPHALNRAIVAAKGEVILRMDGHAVPTPNYVSACVAALDRSGAANAGGVFVVRGSTPFGHAVALATRHPLGAGDVRYRIGGSPGDVDTVPFGTFRRETFERVGLFDESMVRNQDYEMNYRIRRAGLRIYFDPGIRVTYVPRGTVQGLASQYLQYGWWKVETLRRHPASLRWRHAVPPVFLAWFIGWVLAAFWSTAAAAVLATSFAGYAVAIFWISLRLAQPPARAIDVALAFATIHFSWASGFVLNLLTGGRFPYRSMPPRIPQLADRKGPAEVVS